VAQLLMGTVRDEGTLFTNVFAPGLDERAFRGFLATAAGDLAREAGRTYAPDGRSPGRIWSDVVTDRAYACPTLTTAAALARRVSVHVYEFAVDSAPTPFAALPPDLADGIAHGAEVPYLLDRVPGPPMAPDRQGAAANLVDTWARFATTGDAPGIPAWIGDGMVTTITATGSDPRPASEMAQRRHCALWTP